MIHINCWKNYAEGEDAEQTAEERKRMEEEENVPEGEVPEAATLKWLADVGTEKDVIIKAPVKTYSHVGTQTEPLDFFIDCPVDLPLERWQRNVALDHTYNCKPKQVYAHFENVQKR